MTSELDTMFALRVDIAKHGLTVASPEELANDAAKSFDKALKKNDPMDVLKLFKSRRSGVLKPRNLANDYIAFAHGSVTLRFARIAASIGNLEQFIKWYDFGTGVSQVSGNLRMAEGSVTDAELVDDIGVVNSIMFGDDTMLLDEMDEYLSMQRRTNALLELVSENENGFRAVDEIIKRVHNQPNRITQAPYQSFGEPVLERKGVIVAADLYKDIYPLAQVVINEG